MNKVGASPCDPIAALRHGFVDYLRKHFGPRAIVRGSGRVILARANPDYDLASACIRDASITGMRGVGIGFTGETEYRPGDDAGWRVYLSIVADTLKIRLWPADELCVLSLPDPTMWQSLDDALERGTRPIVRWTLSKIDALIRSTFEGRAQVSRLNDEFIVYPDGPYHRVWVALHRDRAGFYKVFEVRHGRQNIAHSDRIRTRVDLNGNFEEVRERLLAALRPLPTDASIRGPLARKPFASRAFRNMSIDPE